VASGSRFWTAKNAPGFGPLRPFIITMEEVPDPHDIWVTCSVNRNQRMRVNTADQIWKLPDIIAHFSRLLPLEPGDMFSTGAPGGGQGQRRGAFPQARRRRGMRFRAARHGAEKPHRRGAPLTVLAACRT
jgi:2-keto-4-pentenoate hydratase/2-oxohepta-3-ene-1,7-dioic acid hydratase in catechol pathway